MINQKLLVSEMFFSQYCMYINPAQIKFESGTRGSGKTRSGIQCFLKYIGVFGRDYKGLALREQYDHLEQLKFEAKTTIKKYCPDAHYNKSESTWYFSGGEILKFGYGDTVEDAEKYQGQQWPYIYLEELTNYKSLAFYNTIKAVNRSPNPRIPCRIHVGANPYGRLHNAVKKEFIDPAPPYQIFYKDGVSHVHIPSFFYENPTILAQPDYLKILHSDRNLNRRLAWLFNKWDITSGGVIDDLWSRVHHVIEPLPHELLGKAKLSVVMDWGSSKPYGIIFVADIFEPFTFEGKHFLKGDVVIFDELYGSTGENKGTNETPSQVQDHVLKKIQEKRYNVSKYLADNQIFNDIGIPSIASYFTKIRFKPVTKGQNSRVQTLNILREKLENALPDKFNHREKTGLFVTKNCLNWIATVPVMPRDEKNPEDADSSAEDHLYDATRYFLQNKSFKSGIIRL